MVEKDDSWQSMHQLSPHLVIEKVCMVSTQSFFEEAPTEKDRINYRLPFSAVSFSISSFLGLFVCFKKTAKENFIILVFFHECNELSTHAIR